MFGEDSLVGGPYGKGVALVANLRPAPVRPTSQNTNNNPASARPWLNYGEPPLCQFFIKSNW